MTKLQSKHAEHNGIKNDLGIKKLDPNMNDHAEAPCAIHPKDSQTKILVLPSEEEWEMASQAAELIL